MKFSKLLLITTTSGMVGLAAAQTERELGSHEHGAAVLNAAIEDGSVFLELETPWNNLVGFEHEPSTDEQRAVVSDALALLEQPNMLFAFDGGSCVLSDTHIENSMAMSDDDHDDHDDEHGDDHDDHDDEHGDDHDDHDDEHADDHDDHDDEHADDHEHDHDDEHGDDHDDDHDDEHGDEHGDDHDDEHGDEHDDDHHDHDDHAEGEDTHSSLLVSYVYDCENVSDVSTISAKFIDIWNGFEDVDVQLIGPGGQAFVELNADNTVIDVSEVQ